MNTLSKSILIVLCITLLSSTQLLAQEWTDEQKEVWAAVEDGWDNGWTKGDDSNIAETYRGWRENWHAPLTKKDNKLWNDRWLQKNKAILWHLSPVAIDIHGDVAILFYSYQLLFEQKDGSDMKETGKWTDIYRKIDGKWLLISDTGFDFISSTN